MSRKKWFNFGGKLWQFISFSNHFQNCFPVTRNVSVGFEVLELSIIFFNLLKKHFNFYPLTLRFCQRLL